MSSDFSRTRIQKVDEVSSREEPTAKLVVAEGKSNLPVLALTQEKTSIGRRPDNDLVLDSAYVSKLHGQVTRQGNQFYLEDLKSTGGIRLNNLQLEPGEKHLLHHGDTIQIVRHILIFSQTGSFTDRQGMSTIMFNKDRVSQEVDSMLKDFK